MSTFGYRRELSKYEDIDEDELLASLTEEELKELERELEDIEPDRNLPVGQRQKSLTEKTPTGTFSREALMAYWERETRKLLEKERLGACDKQEEDNSEDIQEEYFTESNSEVSEEAYTEEDDEEEEEEEEDEDDSDDEDEEKQNAAAGERPEDGRSSDHIRRKKCNSAKDNENLLNGHDGKDTDNLSLKSSAIHPCGNPTVIEDALDKVRSNDPDTTEVNLNNIENITSQMLIQFSQALRDNTVVKSFSLANTHADDNVAIAIAGMLKVNQHITSLNIESNFITGKGVLAIMRALQNNKVLTELRFHNQRHIMGSQVEMDIVKLLKENTTLVKLGYHFDLAGPRMSMTSILTRNMDKQRQKRMQEQRQQESGCDGAISPKTKVLQKGTPRSSPYVSPKTSPWSSPKLPKKAPPVKSQPPPVIPEKKAPTRNIAEVIKQQESSKKALQNGQKKKKGKKSKNHENSILKEIKDSLKAISDRKSEEGSRPSTRPSTPQRSLHDNLMEAIRASSIKQLRRVEVPEALR
ncbi:PREDICTED: leiomodin-2 [Phaethon lepturus]|uniref:leiomodin-2 n=1 Tax=Phaethon lepturus TaxID=97097 RepID=UPI000530B2B6|nr:PREDICTED: leiomodin-2 [Phaethon lepturus]